MVLIIFTLFTDVFGLFSFTLKISEIYACTLLNVVVPANEGASPFARMFRL